MPRIADHDARRAQFAQAVWAVIAERGIEGVTFRRVAAQAGASVGRLQHYYDTREALIQDSARQMITQAADLHGPAAGAEPGTGTPGQPAAGPREQLRALLLHSIPEGPTSRQGIAIWSAYLAKSVDDAVIAELIAEADRGAVIHAAGLLAAAWDSDRRAEALEENDLAAEDLALELMALAQGLASRVLTGSLDTEAARAALDRRLQREGLA